MNFEEREGRKCVVTFSACGGKNKELYVENCRCIRSCGDEIIVLGVYGMDIEVTGTPLALENFGVGGVRITGDIHSLIFKEY